MTKERNSPAIGVYGNLYVFDQTMEGLLTNSLLLGSHSPVAFEVVLAISLRTFPYSLRISGSSSLSSQVNRDTRIPCHSTFEL